MAALYLVAVAWGYVVVLMAVAEATSPRGSVLGAIVTFFLYGALPLGIALYLLATPLRRRARLRREAASAAAADPDRGRHAAADPVPPVREEP